MIAGLDEVGTGALAGPLVVVVTGFTGNKPSEIEGVGDSKKLSREQRETLAPNILKTAEYFGFGWASAETIDKIGKQEAWRLSCLEALKFAPGFKNLYVDGNILIKDYDGRQNAVVGGDASVWEISAASVVAKVIRDQEMRDLSFFFPKYGWDDNVGYGTPKHLKALKEIGPCIQHRMSFLKGILGKEDDVRPEES